MMVQDAMDQHDAWDYNMKLKQSSQKLGIHDTTNTLKVSGGQQNVLYLLKH